jgi:Leucine-rich repeat (LRR) protein
LTNLRQLNLNSAGIRDLNPGITLILVINYLNFIFEFKFLAWFETTTSLNYIYMNFNRLQELPEGSFRNLGELRSLSLWSNQLKLVRRNAFGSIGNLSLLDLEQNGLNAIDQRIFDDAIELRTLYLSNNVCASGSFFDFLNNREAFFARLRNCFCNFLHYVGK